MNSVDDDFEYMQGPGRQAHAASEYHAIVALRSQLKLRCRPSGFIRLDQANVGLPSALSDATRLGGKGAARKQPRVLGGSPRELVVISPYVQNVGRDPPTAGGAGADSESRTSPR